MVKFAHFTSAAWGLQDLIQGADLHTAHQAMLWWCPIYKVEEDWRDVSSGTIFLKRKQGRLAQMLAQGQSFSPKTNKQKTRLLAVNTMQSIQKLKYNNVHKVISQYDLNRII